MVLRSTRSPGTFLQQHSLSLIVLAILALWLALYSRADPETHIGAFYGNAIAVQVRGVDEPEAQAGGADVGPLALRVSGPVAVAAVGHLGLAGDRIGLLDVAADDQAAVGQDQRRQ